MEIIKIHVIFDRIMPLKTKWVGLGIQWIQVFRSIFEIKICTKQTWVNYFWICNQLHYNYFFGKSFDYNYNYFSPKCNQLHYNYFEKVINYFSITFQLLFIRCSQLLYGILSYKKGTIVKVLFKEKFLKIFDYKKCSDFPKST